MTLSRRELLSVLVGAPLAAAACRRVRGNFAGSIRGGSMALGHRLRDASVERASGAAHRVRIAIVGAGPAGLSAAWQLQRSGEKNFVIFELEERPGGTSAYGTDGVVPYPWAAHYVPMPAPENKSLLELLSEIGALDANGEPAETARVRVPEERVFLDGRWYEGLSPNVGVSEIDRRDLARFDREIGRWVRFRDARGRRAFAIPRRRCSDDDTVTGLDKYSARAWLDKNGFRSKRLAWLVDYACRDDYGLTSEQTSAWAMLFYFCARVPAPGAASAPFLTWPEGNGRLVAHLSRLSGPRLKLGKLVTDVVPHDDQVALAVYDSESGSLEQYAADFVILAVPQFVARRMLRPWRNAPPAHVADFSYGAWMVANLHLSRRPRSPGFPLAWDNVVYDSPSLGYVVATHQALSDFGPTIWTYYLPMLDADPNRARKSLTELEHQDFCKSILADLAPCHEDLEDCIERIDVWRWGHAMVRPTPNFLWSSALTGARRPLGRVHFAHSDLSGIALFEEAHDHGVEAALRILEALGRPPQGKAG